MIMRVPILGNILEERFDLAKKYGLVKDIGDVWVTTQKSRDTYEDFIAYLNGKTDKPTRKSKDKSVDKTTVGVIKTKRDKSIDELFNF